ncbi:MAG: hypothetical protein K5668_06470 [Lachnospiraceae bacterium]|nr:hypothetical protein [Lachnospiraceae bacterium]
MGVLQTAAGTAPISSERKVPGGDPKPKPLIFQLAQDRGRGPQCLCAGADAEIKEILPEGIDRTEEAYKKEILKLRIENERLKKTILYGGTRLGNRSMFA